MVDLSIVRANAWTGVRAVYGDGLENRCGASHREFESRPVRNNPVGPTRGVSCYQAENRAVPTVFTAGHVDSPCGLFDVCRVAIGP